MDAETLKALIAEANSKALILHGSRAIAYRLRRDRLVADLKKLEG